MRLLVCCWHAVVVRVEGLLHQRAFAIFFWLAVSAVSEEEDLGVLVCWVPEVEGERGDPGLGPRVAD